MSIKYKKKKKRLKLKILNRIKVIILIEFLRDIIYIYINNQHTNNEEIDKVKIQQFKSEIIFICRWHIKLT